MKVHGPFINGKKRGSINYRKDQEKLNKVLIIHLRLTRHTGKEKSVVHHTEE